MHADISRPTFDATKHFAALLYQQGRLPLDADLNEQTAILLHRLRTVVEDLVGPAARPTAAPGFDIGKSVDDSGTIVDLTISAGRAYVDGILVENGSDTIYSEQPDGYIDLAGDADRLPETPFAVYLRVWPRLITALQDPAIREVALGDPGPDTAARAKVVWQVGLLPFARNAQAPADQQKTLTTRIAAFDPRPGLLAARAKRPVDVDKDPCHLPPDAMFRGPENQLYRIEIHSGGPAWPADSGLPAVTGPDATFGGATFTWSRENGSVVQPIQSIHGGTVALGMLGRDQKLGFEVGDWVETSDDAAASRLADDRDVTKPQQARPLRQVTEIDYRRRTMTLSGAPGDTGHQASLHPVVRRWDHTSPTRYESGRVEVAADGALPVVEGQWITLEDGVEVRFASPSPDDGPGTYRAGQYWMIPARTVTGNVEWPQTPDGPAFRPAAGVHYHYAALAFVKGTTVTPGGMRTFDPIP